VNAKTSLLFFFWLLTTVILVFLVFTWFWSPVAAQLRLPVPTVVPQYEQISLLFSI